MDEITTSNYQRFKQELDTEIKREAEGFVKIGYLLRVARDTDVLKESGYSNVNEFAEKEYSLDASQVSRFISINERFSEGGFSSRLETHYEGFGVAKLSLMLQLPDNLNEQLTPEFTKSEINTLREEVKEEAKTTDIEVMCEEKPSDITDEAVKEMLHDPKLYRDLKQAFDNLRLNQDHDEYDKEIKNILAPSGVAIKSVRVSGVGRIMIKFDETEEVKFIRVRTNETETFNIAFIGVVISELVQKPYIDLYGEELKEEPKEEPKRPGPTDLSKIAPVQPKKEPKKEPKVKPANPVPKVKPEEAEVLPSPEPAKPDIYSVKKPSQIIREDLAQDIEYLHEHLDEIKKDYMAWRIKHRLDNMLEKTLKLIQEENEEANNVGED